MRGKPSYEESPVKAEGIEAGDATRPDDTCTGCVNGGTLGKGDQYFRDLVENSPTGISIIQDDKVVYRNPEQQSIFGPVKQGCYPVIYERVHPDDKEKLFEMIRSTLSGHAPHAGIEFRFIHLSGETVGELEMKWFYCRSNLIEYQGKPAVLINMMDVTREKETQRLLNIKDRMSSLGHVAAGISHEIRNPLSVINVYLDNAEGLLERCEDSESMREILGNIQAASSKIESVIRRVMDFSKPSEPDLLRIDINKPLEDALALSFVTLRKSGIEISTELADGPLPCLGDSQLIMQVVLNLVTNAAEAMKGMDTGKKIRIVSSRKGVSVLVSVADSGPGIQSSLAKKIFEPFFTTKTDSTGIGLSICQRIINDHGGVLSVSPSTLGGAEFTLAIPVNA